MKRNLVLGILLASVFGFSMAEEPAQAASPGTNGRVVFVSSQDGNPPDVYAMEPDGSGTTRLTDDPARDYGPAVSPDGRRVAFVSDRDGDPEIYVMNADGSGVTQLTDSPARDEDPAWSPDGARISYASSDGLRVMNADGSGSTVVARDAAQIADPAWSPDGGRVAFVSYRDGDAEVYAVNADGSGGTRLTADSAQDREPSWSPDGARIVFVSDRNAEPCDPYPQGGCGRPPREDVYAMNPDGSGLENLTGGSPSGGSWPAWSPDGTKILFTSYRDGADAFYTMNPDGSGQSRLANQPLEGRAGSDPDWGVAPAPIPAEPAPIPSPNTAPAITAPYPTPGARTRDATPAIRATVRDGQTDLTRANIGLFVDGRRVSGFSYDRGRDRLTFVPKKRLSPGRHTARVVARDADGLRSDRTWGFRVIGPRAGTSSGAYSR